ncbi:O-antigen polymerase [Tolypothrix tenuis PCC 7101]|uniref:O-antigen polymerase n=1 Tax=Tolypothrix tenuis PCC 7101 TaxID=231146 RepID=A0A1Z4MTZ1_9CYAN|nr:O-antigen ligase family protein [Aulosira sp. FACHB-113]BAY96952.1 O-antigen polymerase [Tolypothrix tenuis PCC 7101]BAZ72540.1 O-antigen polymerase [Aulosira laxa NIES-50]
MLGVSLKQAVYHPNPALQLPWNLTQLGLIFFPLSPFLGAVLIVLASLITVARQWSKIIRRPLNWGFALLSLLLIITAGFAYDKTTAYVGLFNFIPYFIVFAGLSALFQKTAQLRQIAWILVIASAPITILGFGQLFLGWNLDLKFLWIVLEWTIAPGGTPPGRMASILMHANTLAAYLVIMFTLGLALALEQWQLIKKKTQNSSIPSTHYPLSPEGAPSSPVPNPQSLTPLIFLTITGILNFIALIFTNSRNGWAIAIFVCLAYALYQGWRILVGGVAAIVTTVLLAAFAPSPIAQFFRNFVPAFFWARLNDDMYPDRPVALMRKTQWQFAWNLTQQHPWTGWGLRNFLKLYKAETHLGLGHPHNLFLMLSAETGLPATLLFCGLIAWVLIASIKVLQKPQFLEKEDRLIFFSYVLVLLGWVLFNMVDVTIYDFRLNTLFWLILSAVCGLVYRYQKDARIQAKQDEGTI